jgi:hypothetical protein
MTNFKKRLTKYAVEKAWGTEYVIGGKTMAIFWDCEKPFVLGEIGLAKAEAAELLGISESEFDFDEELPFD